MNEIALEVLDLDVERVQAVAETAYGYAAILEGSNDEDARLRAAGMRSLGAACWSFLEPSRAASAFREAAGLYLLLKRPFGVLASVCGLDSAAIEDRGREWTEVRRGRRPDDLAADLIAAAWLAATGARTDFDPRAFLDSVSAASSEVGPRPVGRLGVPVADYVELGSAALRAQDDQDIGRVVEPLRSVMHRMGETTRVAMADHYHWSRLQSGVLPVELESLAAALVVRATADASWDESTVSELVPDGLDAIPLRLADDLWREANPPGNGGGVRPLLPTPLGPLAPSPVGPTEPERGAERPFRA